MEPLRVVVRRGQHVESQHRVHAVAVQDGRVVGEAGSPGLVTFMRSSAKPLQALPLARARDDVGERDLAIASASHLGNDAQLEAVRALLAKAPAGEYDLECGPVESPPERIRHNCSGKHAGMLALCRARGWPSRGYRLADHPAQQAMLAEVSAATELPPDEIARAVDGCGVVTFALALDRMAHAFSRFEGIDGGARVAAAMRAYPELIRGAGAADTVLMQAIPGWFAKGGAEGLICAASPDRVGIALKVEDGNGRAVGPAVAAFLGHLGYALSGLDSRPVENSRGERVGEIAVEDDPA